VSHQMSRTSISSARWWLACTVALFVVGTSALYARPKRGQQASASASLDRALLDQYCVRCHNQKLKTGGVVLDSIVLARVAARAVTPALMQRYMSAAAKISRLAIGSAANRPVKHVYEPPEFAVQNQRMGEDLPFGTHGGVVARHAFPLDGEYEFELRLQRNTL